MSTLLVADATRMVGKSGYFALTLDIIEFKSMISLLVHHALSLHHVSVEDLNRVHD